MPKKIIIIGAGPGGYEAALEGADLGFEVVLIDSRSVGGTCLHEGCIPTKTLYKHAAFLRDLKNAQELGVSIEQYNLNYSALLTRKNKVIDTLQHGIEKALKSAKVTYLEGCATLEDKRVVLQQGEETKFLAYDELIIATGSTPKNLSIPGTELSKVIDSKQLLSLDELPTSLVIIGGGVIGMEFANIFNALGTNVTVLEYLPQILPLTDTDIAKRFALYAKKQGISIINRAKVMSIESQNDMLLTNFSEGSDEIVKNISSEYVMIATGRNSNVNTLGIENTAIQLIQGNIAVDHNFKTHAPHIYAIGDVIGKGQLAHVASSQGRWLMNHLAGSTEKYNSLMPSAVFGFPEIASVGITEDEAKQMNIEYKTIKNMYGAVGKAHAINETDGFMKVLLDSNNKILGVHIIGAHASILIQEAVIAIHQQLTWSELRKIIHVHPTMSELYTV